MLWPSSSIGSAVGYSEDSSYARWRKEVQVLLGAAVHTSYLGSTGAQDRQRIRLSPAGRHRPPRNASNVPTG